MIATRRRMRLFTFLDGSGHTADEVGEKAARLDRAIEAGYPVPNAAVLTTAAYLEATREHSLDLLIQDLRTSALPDPEHIAAESAAIERLFLTAPLAEKLERAIDRVAAEIIDGGLAVVRASVADENHGSRSEPGHYLSVAEIADREGLERAIRRVWASLWLPAGRAHRRKRHMHDHHIAMAIIVQRVVDPLWSGTAHSTDPAGRGHLLRIDAARTGEQSDPLSFLLRKDTLETITADDLVPPFLEDLARIVVRLEHSLGSPQDVEWAFDDSGVTLLQVDPISELAGRPSLDDGFDTTARSDDMYTPHGVIEMLPGVVSPLLWTINAPMLENAFRSAFAELGGEAPDPGRHLVARVRGRAALNLSAICRVAESLPGGNPTEVERQYLGRSITAATGPGGSGEPSNGSGVHLFAALRSRKVHRRIVDDVELIDTAARAIAGLRVELADLPVRNLVAYRQRIRDLAWRGYAAEVGASSAAGATYRALELLLERWLSTDEAAAWAQRLTRTAIDLSTLGGLRATDLVSALNTYGCDEIHDVISASDSPRRTISTLGPVGTRFLGHLDNTVQAMGSKAVYGGETWAEDDPWVWRQLQLLRDSRSDRRSKEAPEDRDYTELISKLSADRKWRRMRILTGQFVDLRARWLRRQVEETTQFLELRERAKNALLILGGEERRIIVEATGRLVSSRQLPSVEVVELLTDAELDGMLFGSCAIEPRELERRRNLRNSCRDADPLPDWFVGEPEDDALQTAPEEGNVHGSGTSPGRVTGTARVVASLADGLRLQRGEVLVAHSTDPSWTPLFLTAAAVVLETGGPLSHASIVAREFGLPAVVNVPGATRIFTDGETITVDGSAGLIERASGGVS